MKKACLIVACCLSVSGALFAQNIVISKQKVLVIGTVGPKLYWISQQFLVSGDPVPASTSSAFLHSYNTESKQFEQFVLRNENKLYGNIRPRWSDETQAEPVSMPQSEANQLTQTAVQAIPLFGELFPFETTYNEGLGFFIRLAGRQFSLISDTILNQNLKQLQITRTPKNLGLYVSDILSYKTHRFLIVKNSLMRDRYSLELLIKAPTDLPFPDKSNADTARVQ